jgi:hypothetical protein
MIAVIDGDSLLYLSLPKKNGEHYTYEYCLDELNNRIKNIMLATEADEYVICLTVGRCFRYKDWIYSNDYKYKRKNSKRPPIFYALNEHLKQNYNVYYKEGLEADDLVCCLQNYLKKEKKECIVCSMDKDVLYQIEGLHFNYGRNEFVKVTKNEAVHFLYKQLVTGDPTDNITGIRGVGEKTVERIFKNKKMSLLPEIVLSQYLKNYVNPHEAINRFNETFKMVYILKSFHEAELELKEEITLPKFERFERNEREGSEW